MSEISKFIHSFSINVGKLIGAYLTYIFDIVEQVNQKNDEHENDSQEMPLDLSRLEYLVDHDHNLGHQALRIGDLGSHWVTSSKVNENAIVGVTRVLVQLLLSF